MSLTRTALVAFYSTIVIWWIGTQGIPLDRHVVLIFLFGAAAIVLAGRDSGFVRRAIIDWFPLVAALIAYDVSRGAADALGMPVHTAYPIAVDRFLFGTPPTLTLQSWLGPFDERIALWEVVVSVVYASHFVAPFAVGVWFWSRDRQRWVWWRDRLLTLTAFGLAVYIAIPTVPPWLAARRGDLEFVDRTAHRGWMRLGVDTAPRLIDLGQAAVNPVAAMPSLHAAFAAFVAVSLW